MVFDTLGQLRPQVQFSFWAGPGQGQTIDELVVQLREAGNAILHVGQDQVLVAQWTEDQDRWGCRFCVVVGAVTICDSETELLAHCDHAHPDWRTNGY